MKSNSAHNVLVLLVVYLAYMMLSCHAQYFSAAQRGNIPRLGKRTDMTSGMVFASPMAYSNSQEIAQPAAMFGPNQNVRNGDEDNMWLLPRRGVANKFKLGNFLAPSRPPINEIDAIQSALVNLLANINQYKKGLYEEFLTK